MSDHDDRQEVLQKTALLSKSYKENLKTEYRHHRRNLGFFIAVQG